MTIADTNEEFFEQLRKLRDTNPASSHLCDMLATQHDALQQYRAELDGYKARAELCEANEHKFVVALKIDKGPPTMSVFGPSPTAERRFGETLIRYCGLLGFVSRTTYMDVQFKELSLLAEQMADAAGALVCDTEFFLDGDTDAEKAKEGIRESIAETESAIKKFRKRLVDFSEKV